MHYVSMWESGREGFENGKSIMIEETDKMYDSLYASVYNALWHPHDQLEFERVSIQDIALAELPKASVKILDLCCGVSPHACWFKNLGVEFSGIDISTDMLEKARNDCPSASFQKGDIISASVYAPKSYSHLLLLGFAIYQFPNSKMIFDNAYIWTQPGGYFIVHLVEPDKFDPLLNLASPFAAFSLQKYSLERQTKSEIYFNKFKYSGNFLKKKNEDDAIYSEVFTFFDGDVKYREQKHKWTMPSLDRMIEIGKSAGFRVKEKVHLVSCSREYQYLVYFTK